ncbi:anti-sigma factor [Amnibacterium setariae]|uniref:Regulator of SigK n=1 Tax=Amnibacterium setariae TaxID=2306585 RepID=A0A3A1U200_9MICO|nr:anti-sigma factor [Amnibacterium setariae]RIX30482.1 anti-sigma factor [Amnibacterium setariae]
MTKREDVHLLSGAYALDAVTAEEAALVEAAMVQSEELRSEVVGLSDTAVALGLGIAPIAPPAALRARLLDAIDALPQQPAEEPAGSLDAVEPASVDAPRLDVVAPAETVVAAVPAGDHLASRRRRRRRPMAALALVAAAVVLFSGGFLVQRTLLEPQREYTSVVTASDRQKVVGSVAGGGVATVTWSPSEHRTAVELTGVTPPSGKVLQLWSVRGDTITSAGLYDGGQRYALIAGTPSSGEVLAVSVEPDGGSTQPTTRPIVQVRLDA